MASTHHVASCPAGAGRAGLRIRLNTLVGTGILNSYQMAVIGATMYVMTVPTTNSATFYMSPMLTGRSKTAAGGTIVINIIIMAGKADGKLGSNA